MDEFNTAGGIDLFPVSDSPDDVRFAHQHGAALFTGLAFLAGAGAAWTFIPETAPRIIFTIVGAWLALQGISASTYRYEVSFDTRQRTWRRRMGKAGAVSTDTGSMDDLKAVTLTVFDVNKGSGTMRHKVSRWRVSLEMKGPAWTEPLIVGIAKREQNAHRLLEKYARLLQVDAVDRAHDVEVRRSWQDLDRPLADSAPPEPRSIVSWFGAPPAGSDISVATEGGYRRLTLGPAASLPGRIAQVLLGLPLAGLGAWTLVTTLTPDASATSPQVLFAGFFTVAGLALAFRGAAAGGREWVLDGADTLTFGVTGLFGSSRRQSLVKREIEEVALVTNRQGQGGETLHVLGFRVRLGPTNPEHAGVVRVRSDRGTVHVGYRLPPEGRAWLRDALESMVRGGILQHAPDPAGLQ